MDPKKFKKVALVGATINPRKYGNVMLKDLASKDSRFYRSTLSTSK